MTMNEAKIRIREEELLKLVLDFLTSRNFFVSMRTLEKESGVVNSPYTDDILFLRELILDGDWEEVLMFAQPFDGLNNFNAKQFKYLILKQKFLELLSLKSHVVGKQTSNSIEDVMKTLNLLEESCPSKEEYSNLCWLLTVPNLSERSEFKDWTLDNSRLKCFNAALEVIGKVITPHKRTKKLNNIASKDRLLQLVVKGLFYETSIEYCQGKATATNVSGTNDFSVRTNLLQGIADDYSANLLSWIRSLQNEVFTQPFEQVSVEIVLEKLSKAERNLRHSIDVPKKTGNDGNIVFRSLVSLDLENKPNKVPMSSRHSISTLSHERIEKKVSKEVDFQPEEKVSKEQSHADLIANYDNVPKLSNEDLMFMPKKNPAKHFQEKEKHSNSGNKAPDLSKGKRNELKDKKDENDDFVLKLDGLPMENAKSKSDIFYEKNVLSDEKAEDKSLKRNQESIEEALHEKEERKRRESVMKKLEEYENRKKIMQMQLEQMSQGFATRNAVIDEKTSEDPFKDKTKDQALEKEPAFHRQYVAAKDFVTDYKTDALENQVHSLTKKPSEEKADEYKPHATDVGKRPPFQPRNDQQFGSTERGNLKSQEEKKSQPNAVAPKTPKNVGYVVSLSDGSGKISTSTPKPKRRNFTETPPPVASPVKPLAKEHSTPKASTKKNIHMDSKQTRLVNEMSQDRHQHDQMPTDMTQKDENAPTEGKENTPEDGDASRKGPMINGVRRTLAAQPQPAAPQPVDNTQTKRIEQKNAISKPPGKSKTEGDATVKTSQENKPLNKQAENAPQHKGPGPKIKMRDGTKVLVTELLKSREEIKNATANSQKNDSTEREESPEIACNEDDVELKEPPSSLQFSPVSMLEDAQAIRAVCFHPDGNLFAVGSNSKILRICAAKSLQPVISPASEGIPQPNVVFKRNKYHKGSIYCITWNPLGDIIATGSNDKSIKILRFDPDNCVQEGSETELGIHSGTVRELSFAPDKPALLVSGGAGDGAVQITDCSTCQTIGSLRGHTGNVMSVFAGDGDIVATGSTDNTLRLWDLRSHRCIDVILVGDSSPASVALSRNGSYLASGQEDGCILLYDISAGRTLQSFRLHQEDCRSVRFSPDSKYLLTGSYDTDVSLLHTDGDLESMVPRHYKVASHKDKVIQCRWHPNRYTFLSSSADRTAILWSSGLSNNLLFS